MMASRGEKGVAETVNQTTWGCRQHITMDLMHNAQTIVCADLDLN